jgi:glutathione S-transferase
MMKLHWSPRSPFVRKVMIVAHETGLTDKLTLVRTVAVSTRPHPELMHDNPLSKIPTLVLENGQPLYDSPVICEYFDQLHTGPKLFPAERDARFAALRRQALGDGLLDLLILLRGESLREQPSDVYLASYAVRRKATLAAMSAEVEQLSTSPFSIGHIAIGCALGYLDFRFASEDWRQDHAQLARWHADFSARPSVRNTEPIDDS